MMSMSGKEGKDGKDGEESNSMEKTMEGEREKEEKESDGFLEKLYIGMCLTFLMSFALMGASYVVFEM